MAVVRNNVSCTGEESNLVDCIEGGRNNVSCTGEELNLVDCIEGGSESIQVDNHTCESNSAAGVTCVTLIGEF